MLLLLFADLAAFGWRWILHGEKEDEARGSLVVVAGGGEATGEGEIEREGRRWLEKRGRGSVDFCFRV